MTEPIRLRRQRAINLLRGGLLLKFALKPTSELRLSQVEKFFDDFGLELVPEIDREAVVESLLEDRLIEDLNSETKHRSGVDRYGLTSVGISTIEAKRQKSSSYIHKILINGNEWLQKQVEDVYGVLMESPLEALPAPPSFDIDFSKYVEQQKQLLTRLEQLVEALNANNAFKHADKTNYIWVMADLADLKRQASGATTTVSKLERVGFGALTFVVKKFADTIISTLATDVWQILINLAGHLV